MLKKIFSFSNFTLLVALTLSTIAAWYSIIGLTAIFAGAVIPIIIMGSALELAKISTTVWLRKYWHRATWKLKIYLVPAVILLALLTSMGIFGFLSKAHMEQGVPTGDIAAKVALIDEKIKTQRDNIEVARTALSQMDAQVNARLDRGSTEQGAERAVQIRRQQQGERNKLQKEIGDAQKEIAKLNEERAPIASELRKVEAEVGPIKYIAALIYGDNADQNMLEAAVRWVTILLVLVFDPLAIVLVLAANSSKEWDEEEQNQYSTPVYTYEDFEKPTAEEVAQYEQDDGPLTDDQIAQIIESAKVELVEEPKVSKDPHPVGWMYTTPEVKKTKPRTKPKKKLKEDAVIEDSLQKTVEENPKFDIDKLTVDSTVPIAKVINPEEPKIEEDSNTSLIRIDGEYIEVEGKQLHRRVALEMYPELLKARPDEGKDVAVNFGTVFPKYAQRGDIFTRVDSMPNRVYKYDGHRWLELNKVNTVSYLSQPKYIEFLVNKISTGEYDLESLTDSEQQAVEDYLRTNQSL